MRIPSFFILLLVINFVILLAQIGSLSIGYHEAKIIYGAPTILKSYINTSLYLFGSNDYALRIPMIVLHILSVVLLYSISSRYVTKDTDRLWLIAVYILLPGVTSAALLVNYAGVLIALVFFFVWIYQRIGWNALFLLPLYVWINPAFCYLFLSIALYGLYTKNFLVTGVGSFLLLTSIYLFGSEIGGRPEGHLLDLFGLYAAIFSPIVFVYLFYVLYRRLISKQIDLIWFIAFTAFFVSLLMSFRQKVDIQFLAPFLLLALPLMAQTFLHTFRVRLPQFRRRYRVLLYSAFSILILNALVVFFNQLLYVVYKDPTSHFSYPMHVVKELAKTLKSDEIYCVNAKDQKLQLRLKFYGIDECENVILDDKGSDNSKIVTISYIKIPIYKKYVTKINI